ncbi:urea ABC transporter ATP-binding protein UrtD [Glycomyces buryatensis]|uniref:Urea ABC transporter ATP-binding protein UrtD n=1 Tax=Glycomyces buryatensis TaxID=2570927 RepID=A0A4S8PUE5_9ACTN|nr:urea ABC transporter ATP-binding protein UrtD [Glycomyces buryatensis]THV33505.1 urea ABC transporter ATP-binding protein UrtD [Glycomyces buryatensis]
MNDVLLTCKNIEVSFDGFKAVDGVDLELRRGEVHFLIGPNGAGKTTLVDAITGLAKYTGSVTKDGEELRGKKIPHIARKGIGRTFQTATVFENLTVAQNLDIAAGAGRSPWSLLRRRKHLPQQVLETMERIGLADHAGTDAGILAHGQKQWLEIGMLLVGDADVLLLDEPIAGMGHEERETTGKLLHDIAADRAVAVVEHDMDFMRANASRVTVLHAGAVLAAGSVDEVSTDAKVQEVYLGTSNAAPSETAPSKGAPSKDMETADARVA